MEYEWNVGSLNFILENRLWLLLRIVDNNIIWIISDDDPMFWVVLRDGVHVDQNMSPALNETVVIDIDGLNIGIYNFKILFGDFTHNVTDEV